MVSNDKLCYIASLGNSREARMWNSAFQIAPILMDLSDENVIENLYEINLSNNSIGLEACEAIANKIKNFKNITVAGYHDIFVGRLKDEIPKSLTYLIRAIETKNIQVLNLSDNAYGPSGVSAFDFYLAETTSLKELYLENNGLGPEGASLVANALKNNSVMHQKLQRIRIGRNRLENKGATALAGFFERCTALVEIVCFQNGIKDEGMSNLLQSIGGNNKLEILKVNDNNVKEKSIVSLLALLEKIQMLRHIDVSDSALGSDSAVQLFEKLSHLSSLQEVICNYNEIEDKESQTEIYNHIANFKGKLVKLEIKGNEIKKSIFKKFKVNSNLKDITDCYSDSEMDPEDLAELMGSLSIQK